jgi:hydroxyethylthiazole kinase-like uncharacterized protein yjeF
MSDFTQWDATSAARHIAVPVDTDDKYSRGVLGVITGSTQYPGAAVLGVEAALHTGLGMVRYLGPSRVSKLVLERRPETVTSNGRVQAWLIGSGMDYANRDEVTGSLMDDAVAQGVPVILDGGALDLVTEVSGPTIITPHFRELARVTGWAVEDIASDPGVAATSAAASLGLTVLLKGNTTYVARPDGTALFAQSATPWLATAGTGDALGGILGALVATHAVAIADDPGVLAELGATASVLHGLAAQRASDGGPFTVLDLIAELPAVISGLLRGE